MLRAAVAAAAMVLFAGGGRAAAEQPNVLVVMTDDQVLEQMVALPKTQELLGEQGTTFTQAVVEDSLCCPSRSTFMSGQHARNHGVLNNVVGQGGGYPAFDFSNALAVWLQEAGYWTAHVGKQLNGYGADPQALPLPAPGYDDWFATIDPSTYSSYNWEVSDNGIPRFYGFLPADYQTDVLAERVVTDIRARAGSEQPWFIHFAPQPPHWEIDMTTLPLSTKPPQPAPRHAGAFADLPLPGGPEFDEADVSDKPALIQSKPPITPERRAEIEAFYRQGTASLLSVDDAVERFVAVLQETGQLDDTLIIFISDNGFYNGEHRLPNSKSFAYEEGLRVPLIVRGPGFAPGSEVHAPVSNVDIAPTIVRAAGATAQRVMDGTPLQDDASPDRVTFHEAKVRPDNLVSEGGSKLDFTSVRTRRWKLIQHADTGERELYDLLADPHELQSLHASAAHEAIRSALAVELALLETCTGPACVRELRPPAPGCRPGAARLNRRGAPGIPLATAALDTLTTAGSPRGVSGESWTWCRTAGGRLRAHLNDGVITSLKATGRRLTRAGLATGQPIAALERRHPGARRAGSRRYRLRRGVFVTTRKGRVRSVCTQ